MGIKWLIAYGTLLMTMACSQSPSAVFTEGVTALREGRWHMADSLFSLHLLSNPQDADAFNNRALARKELNRHDDALIDARQSVALDEENVLYTLTLGEILFAQGKVEEAAQTAQQATILAPDNPNTWYFLGSVRMAQGDFEGAIRSLRKSLDIDGGLRIAAQQIIAAYILAGRFDKALFESNKLINAGMPDAINLRNRAYAYLMSGNPELALTDLNKALLIDSTDAIAWNNKARAYLLLNDFQSAKEALDAARHWDATNPFIYKHSGLYYLSTGDTLTACIYWDSCATTLASTWPVHMLQADAETDSLIQQFCTTTVTQDTP